MYVYMTVSLVKQNEIRDLSSNKSSAMQVAKIDDFLVIVLFAKPPWLRNRR